MLHEFEKKVENLDNKSKGDMFEIFCKDYIKQNLSPLTVELFSDISVEQKHNMHLMKQDTGIDIIFIDKDKKINAVQCKYRNNRQRFLDVSTFYASCYIADIPIKNTWLMTNCYKCDKLTERNKDRINIINYYTFTHNQKQCNYDTLVPNIIQKECLECINDEKKFTLILPCGIGKTFIAWKIIKKLNPKSVLIITPALSLIDQYHNIFPDYALNCMEGSCSDKDQFIISTYQSIDKLKDRSFDMIIYDEAHHSISPEYSKSLDIKSDYKIFMTATKRIVDQSDTFESMDDEKKYGKTLYSCDISKGIKEGILCPFKVYYVAQKEYSLSLIYSLMTQHKRKKLLIFHELVEDSEEFTKILSEEKDFADIKIMHIDANTKNRKELLSSYEKSDRSILNNVGIAKEGLNIPCIDCIIFMCNKNSEIDIIQSIGRGLRIAPDKENLYVITFGQKNFNNILANIIENDTFYKQKYYKTDKMKKICGCLNCSNCENKPDEEWTENIELRLQLLSEFNKKNILSFDDKVQMVKEFIEKNEDKYPAQHSVENIEKTLGLFIMTQRKNYKKNNLSEDKIIKLETIKNWKWKCYMETSTISKVSFDDKVNLLKEFVEKNNGRYPSQHSKDDIEKTLGLFVGTQRKNYKKNKLSKDKIMKLEMINGWIRPRNKKTSSISKISFDEKVNLLKEFIEKNNRYPLKRAEDGIEKTLGCFIQRQRMIYKKNKLSGDKIIKLEMINGWIRTYNKKTSSISKISFDDKVNLLKEFVEKNNKYPLKRAKDDIEKTLGLFIQIQRKNHKKNKLSEDKITKLETINGWKWSMK